MKIMARRHKSVNDSFIISSQRVGSYGSKRKDYDYSTDSKE